MSEKLLGILGGISFGGLITYLGIDGESLTIFSMVLLLDFIFGIMDVYVTDKTEIKSKIAWRGLLNKITKLLLPMIVVIVLRGVGFEDLKLLISSIMGILIVSEGYSVIGHIYSINTGKCLPEIDAFELLISKVGSIFRKLVSIFSDDIIKDK